MSEEKPTVPKRRTDVDPGIVHNVGVLGADVDEGIIPAANVGVYPIDGRTEHEDNQRGKRKP